MFTPLFVRTGEKQNGRTIKGGASFGQLFYR